MRSRDELISLFTTYFSDKLSPQMQSPMRSSWCLRLTAIAMLPLACARKSKPCPLHRRLSRCWNNWRTEDRQPSGCAPLRHRTRARRSGALAKLRRENCRFETPRFTRMAT